MRILKANLAYRFYTSDGWTRTAVQDFYNCKLSLVIPRYYDMEADEWIVNEMTKFELPKEFVKHCNDCDYFSVYSMDVKADVEKLKQHQVDFV